MNDDDDRTPRPYPTAPAALTDNANDTDTMRRITDYLRTIATAETAHRPLMAAAYAGAANRLEAARATVISKHRHAATTQRTATPAA